MVPYVASSSPAIRRSRVDLPHPDGPTSTRNSPSSIRSETSSTAATPPPKIFETRSRTISANGDELLSAHEDGLDLEPVVEHDEIGVPAGAQDAGACAHNLSGYRGRGRDRFRERGAEQMQVPDPVEHRRHATGEDAVLGAAGDAVAHLDLDAAEPVAAVADSRCGDRVGDDRHPALGGLVGKMMAVEDHLDDYVLPGQRCACQPWVTVREGAHRVEEVRHGAHAAVERRPRLLGGGVRVAARDDDAASL